MDEQYKADLQDKIEDTQERLRAMQAFAAGHPVWFSSGGAAWSRADPANCKLVFSLDRKYRATPPEPPNLKLELELTPETALVLLALLNVNEVGELKQIAEWGGYTAHIEVPPYTCYKAFWVPEDSVARKLQKYLDEVVQAKGE